MSTHFRGVGGASGIAVGRAFCFQEIAATQPPPADEAPDAALARLATARAAAASRLRSLAERQRAAGRADEAGLFDAQALLVEDDFITEEVTRLIGDEAQPLEAALDATIGQMRAAMEALDDPYLRERAADMDAIGKEIRRALHGGGPAPAEAPPGAIVLAGDLTPAETVELPPHIAGFATAYGGPTGHTAILARSLGIPAVVGLGAAALAIADGAELILDGDQSLLIAEPDPAERADYARRMDERNVAQVRRQALRAQPGRLADDHAVALWANIGRPEEASRALDYGAEGIGLFRTEFLFLDRPSAPSEDEQYAAYRATL